MVKNDVEKVARIKDNTLFSKELLSLDIRKVMPDIKVFNNIISHRYVLESFENNVPWITIDSDILNMAIGIDRYLNVVYAILKADNGDARLPDIFEFLYRAMYTKIWHDTWASDNSDSYIYLHEFSKFTSAIQSIPTIQSKNLRAGIISRVASQLHGYIDKATTSTSIFIKLISWYAILFAMTFIVLQLILYFYGINTDSKIIAIIVSAPLAGAIALAVGYRK